MNGIYPGQGQPFTNVRLRDKWFHSGGEWFCNVEAPDLRERLIYFRRELAILQKEEPESGWVLEVRGTQADWHKMEGT